MKKFYYAVQDKNAEAHVLTVLEGQNLAATLKRFDFVIVHPCETYKKAVKIVEAWRTSQT